MSSASRSSSGAATSRGSKSWRTIAKSNACSSGLAWAWSDAPPRRSGALAGVGEQRGLADARRALEQHDAARAAAGGRERGVELRDLLGALEQFRRAVTPFSIDPVDHRFAPRWVPVGAVQALV